MFFVAVNICICISRLQSIQHTPASKCKLRNVSYANFTGYMSFQVWPVSFSQGEKEMQVYSIGLRGCSWKSKALAGN